MGFLVTTLPPTVRKGTRMALMPRAVLNTESGAGMDPISHPHAASCRMVWEAKPISWYGPLP